VAQPIQPSKTALTLSVILGSAGLILALAITGAYLSLPLLIVQVGRFCIEAYGILAYWLPLYLFMAALLLSGSYYRPDKIFALTASIIPFFTLALGLYSYNTFDQLVFTYPVLTLFGRIGIILVLVLILLVEFFIIYWITRAIAEQILREGSTKTSTMRPYQDSSEKGREAPLQKLLEDRRLREEKNASPPLLEELQPATEPVDPVIFELPDTKPLASTEAYKSLHSSSKPVEVVIQPIIEEAEPVQEYTGSTEEPQQPTYRPSGKQGVSPETSQEIDQEPGQALTEAAKDVDQDLEQALTEAEILAEAIAREKEVERSENRAETAKGKPNSKGKPFSITNYQVPVEGLLTAYPDGQYWIIDQATRDAAVILKETLKEFNIQAEVTGIRKGPVITMFEILPAPGVKLSKIVNLQDNIALRLAASSVRIVAPIPGKHAVGIEVPNRKRNIVSFREMIEGELHREGKRLEIPVILGKDITGEAQTIDLVQTPHLLIAGATGSGKSVCVNSMILSILYQRSPAEVRLMLIDPKIVELKLYNDIPHLLTPVITEPKRAFQALQYCIYEMERRYALLDSMGVRDIRSYNKRIKERNIATERLPYIVVVIDEFADLMATTGKELESTVARLAAMSRAVGIHLVLATQRPSIDVITGLIKANIPSRIAFMVASKMDSRIIIDMVGAEKLLGKGDMLYAGAVDPFPVRIQGAFVSEEEVEKVVEYVKGLGEPDYLDDEIFYDEEEEDAGPSLFDEGDDPLYEKALEIVYQQGKASASYIQRRLKIGYNRAARIVEMMEERGIVGPAQGSKPRELLRGQ
jgi:S-DNA-T family DNA segregation ATPase FtsK/SpoIIIE